MNNIAEFNKRLKKLREEKGITPKAMAEKLEVSVSTYRDWEYGRKITGEPYVKISEVLNIGLGELFGKSVSDYSEFKEAIKSVREALNRLESTCESLF